MSHNKLKIGTATPDASSDLSVALSDLSDVTITSVSSGQALEYNGAAWVNSTNAITVGAVFCGSGASQNYSTSTASGVANGDVVQFYSISPHNSLSATITSASSWVSAVTIPVGTYRVSALVALTFSSAGSGEFRIHNGGTAVGGTGTYAQDDADCTSIATAIITVTSGTAAIDVRLTSVPTNINTITNQGTRQAELGYLIIDRLA
jgi:hypothetical protein